jgi:hypothetical protein
MTSWMPWRGWLLGMLTDERTVLPPPQVSKVGTLQYLLTVISDLFEMNNVAVRALFHECGRTSKVPSWHYFLKTLTCKEDEFVVHQANRILVQLASDGIEPLDQRNLVVYFMWLCPQVSAYVASVWLERAACLSPFLQVCRITLRSDSRAYPLHRSSRRSETPRFWRSHRCASFSDMGRTVAHSTSKGRRSTLSPTCSRSSTMCTSRCVKLSTIYRYIMLLCVSAPTCHHRTTCSIFRIVISIIFPFSLASILFDYTVATLTRRTTEPLQAQYLTAYCAWVITFDSAVAARLGVDGSSLTKFMVELLEGTRKPKVVRMCLAYFRNLVLVAETKADRARNGTALVGLNMLNILFRQDHLLGSAPLFC